MACGDFELAERDFASRTILLQENQEGSRLLSELPGGLLERDFWLARSNEDHPLTLSPGDFQQPSSCSPRICAYSTLRPNFPGGYRPRIVQHALPGARILVPRHGAAVPVPLLRNVRQAVDAADIEHARALLSRLAADRSSATRTIQRDILLLESLLSSDSSDATARAEAAWADQQRLRPGPGPRLRRRDAHRPAGARPGTAAHQLRRCGLGRADRSR